MYLSFGSGAHGHATSFSPVANGAPTECMQGMKVQSSPSFSITSLPVRDMMRMLETTYGESVISTPIWQIGEFRGPIAKGITYSVRPLMQHLKISCIFF